MRFSVIRIIGLLGFTFVLLLNQLLANDVPLPDENDNLSDENIKVVFFSPEGQSNSYWWNTCSYFMRSAAYDLGVDLQIYYAERSQIKLHKAVDTVLNATETPDYILMQNMKSTAVDVIEKANQKNVKVLLFNSGLSDVESNAEGGPREKHSNWIGQILPDDESAGYELAATIVNAAKREGLFNQNGKIEMLALGGTISDTSAMEREKGLMRYLDEYQTDVVLNRGHVLPANWESAVAGNVFETAFSLFPDTKIVWNANDDMAMGVLNAAKTKLGLEPGVNILIGGIDWNPDALESVKAGELEATLGGHFAECIWTMVLLHDYANGTDFKVSGNVSMKSKFSTLTSTNVDRYSYLLSSRSPEKIEGVDFRKFSKIINPRLVEYEFDLDRVLEQLQ